VYEENRLRGGRKTRIEECAELIKFVEEKVLSEEKWSIDSAIGFAKEKELFTEFVTTKTFYNWVDRGLTKLKNMDLLLKVRRKARKEQPKRRRVLGRSIDERPKEVETREEFGHWEGDGIVGKEQKGHLITLVERLTGIGLLFNVGDKQDGRIVEVLKYLKEEMGEVFAEIFKSITFDNGSEFARSDIMENEIKTQVYYAHPYSSWERGTNENWNGMVRRYIPKGSSFEKLTDKDMSKISNCINTLPRKRFGYHTPLDLWKEKISAIINNSNIMLEEHQSALSFFTP
ncbi:MAG: IS30 family transposase, partial [Clostridiales bacterium]|nr:IS30 family transposase [Clostridiales bacterium]